MGRRSRRQHGVLAPRAIRLVAFIVDAAILWGALFVSTLLPRNGGALVISLVILLVLLLYAAVQITLLARRGQTIGKRLLGIRIVLKDSGHNGGFVTNVVVRAGIGIALGIVVPFYVLIDVLFIFKGDRRRVTDRIAGTIVVRATTGRGWSAY